MLAAGGSTRLGRPKQLVAFRGRPLARHAALVALESGLGPVLVVVGAAAEQVAAVVADLDVRLVRHEGWRRGLATSVAAGVRAARDLTPPVGAAILMACDQPHVAAPLLVTLAERHRTGSRVAGAEYGGTLGVPAIVDRSLFDELSRLEGDQGAASVIARHRDPHSAVPAPEAAIDIDTESEAADLSQ